MLGGSRCRRRFCSCAWRRGVDAASFDCDRPDTRARDGDLRERGTSRLGEALARAYQDARGVSAKTDVAAEPAAAMLRARNGCQDLAYSRPRTARAQCATGGLGGFRRPPWRRCSDRCHRLRGQMWVGVTHGWLLVLSSISD